jgi:phage protein D/phage baseplate assembly protein gpV
VASTQELISRIYLSFDGAEASQEVIDSIISVEVDDSLILPDMFAIHLQDSELRWIDDDTFSVGKSVDISTGEGSTKVKILSGEITGIEPRLLPNIGPSLMLRGYDMSHRLNRGKKTTTYIQMTDGDIAKKVAQNAGLRSKIDPTRQVNEYVMQDNKTDWEFLVSRAQRIGYRVLVKAGKLHFVELPEAGEQTPTLKWGEDLVEFNARLTTARQVTAVIVQGWDPDRQQQIVGEATQPRDTPDIGERSQDGGQTAERAFGGSAKEIVVDRPVATQEEADILAQAICDEIGQGFLEAECVSFGNPAIQAGVMIKLEGLGSRFSGTYRVTHALHRYDASGYTTEFTIGGRYASTISELLSTTDENDRNWGPVLGVVTNNDDPDAQGRVKVKIPSLKDSEESNWARLVAGGAGNGRGFQCMPEVGDEVLVVFEHEDIHKPLIIGGLWSDKYKPPTASNECLGSDGVKIRQMVTRTGTKLVLDDEKNSITISNPDEKFCLKISESDKKVEIVSDGDVVVNAQQNVQVEAKGNVTVTGQQVEVNAKTNAKITASANMNLEASGVMTIKGATIQLN